MNVFNAQSDRRRFQRLALNLSVNYRVDSPWYVRLKIGDKEIEATALNVSEGGMALVTDYNIPVSTLLFITFSLFKADKHGDVVFFTPVVTDGKVRSNLEYEKESFRLGIAFVCHNGQARSSINHFIKLAS